MTQWLNGSMARSESRQRLGCCHIVEAVVDPNHDHVFGGKCRFRALGALHCGIGYRGFAGYGNAEVVVLDTFIGEQPDGLDEVPVAGIQRILSTLDGREVVGSAESNTHL